MYYLNSNSNEAGNYGNPTSLYIEGMITLPDNLLKTYIDTKGFANLTVENNIVTALEVNQEAFDAYETEHPDSQEEIISEEDDVNAMLIDHEYRLIMLELGITE